MNRFLRRACFFVFAGAALVVGCRSGSSEKMAQVTGKVTVGGQPLTGGNVTFMPVTTEQGAAGTSAGQIDKSGVYTIYTGGKAGAPLGKYKVTVTPNMVPTGDGKAPSAPFNQKFQNASQTPLLIQVVENPAGDAYDLKLTK